MKHADLQQQILETLGSRSWEYDLVSGKVDYSEGYQQLLGYRPDEREFDTSWVRDNIHPKDLHLWEDVFVRCIKGQIPSFDCELRFKHRDDSYVWIQTRGAVIERDGDGRALRMGGLVFDLSDRHASKEAESRFRLFLDNIPDAISLKDSQGRYLYINRQFERWIGKPSYQIHGRTAEQIFDSESNEYDLMQEHERLILQQGEVVSMEREFPMTDDGKIRHAVITKFPIFDESGRILGIGTTNTDVSERHRSQEILRASELRYRRLFESAPAALFESNWSRARLLVERLHDEGVVDIAEHLRHNTGLIKRFDDVVEFINYNDEALRLYGLQDDASYREFIHGEMNNDQRLGVVEVIIAFAAGRRRSRIQTVTLRRDGVSIPIIRTCEMTSGDRQDWSSVLVCIQDISAEVEAASRLRDYQLELRSLAGQISLAEERERRRISSELHDGTIQNLVLSRMHLGALKNSLAAGSQRETAANIDELIEASLKETRSLIFEISPPVLYELGLQPAVEWLVDHYRQRTDLDLSIDTDGGGARLNDELTIVVFQAARELLMNIVKHAQASRVTIRWRHRDDEVLLSVDDDGIGFDVDSREVRRATEGGFGLFSIRERLILLGAELDIESSNSGTRVTIHAPLETRVVSVTG